MQTAGHRTTAERPGRYRTPQHASAANGNQEPSSSTNQSDNEHYVRGIRLCSVRDAAQPAIRRRVRQGRHSTARSAGPARSSPPRHAPANPAVISLNAQAMRKRPSKSLTHCGHCRHTSRNSHVRRSGILRIRLRSAGSVIPVLRIAARLGSRDTSSCHIPERRLRRRHCHAQPRSAGVCRGAVTAA